MYKQQQRAGNGGQQHRKQQRTSLRHLAIAMLLTATCSICLLAVSTWHKLPTTYQTTARDADELDRIDDLLVHQIVQQCMMQQETMITYAPGAKQQQVLTFTSHPPKQLRAATKQCPLAFIPLAPSDRSIGLCTDAALYVQLLGALIVPDTSAARQRAHGCGHRSAVMFVEPLYESWMQWLDKHPAVVAVYAPNFEHVFGYDKQAHQRMQLVLCKVHRCSELIVPYLSDIGSTATVAYTGHTSLDPQALVAAKQPAAAPSTSQPRHAAHRKAKTDGQTQHQQQQQPQAPAAGQSQQPQAPAVEHQQQQAQAPATEQQQQQLQPHDPAAPQTQQNQQQHQPTSLPAPSSAATPLAAAAEPLAVLHVRGKSSLKHTKQLLDCWLTHPEWPKLTVLGPMPNEQINLHQTKEYVQAGNIAVPRPGKAAGPSWPEFDPLPAAQLAQLLMSHPLHIMPSEREGFGHSINEGRAAGALLIVPDHPPMNELVRQGSGCLIEPHARFSHEDAPVPVLGKYGNISVSISPQNICGAVSRVLQLSQEDRLEMGRKARQLFEADRKDFEARMQQVQVMLEQLTAPENSQGKQQLL